MCTIHEQVNEWRSDLADVGGWRQFGNLEVTHDGTKATVARADGAVDGAYAWPLPASDGAGFLETTVTGAARVTVDMVPGTYSATEWVGPSLRSERYAFWAVLNTTSGDLVGVLDDGSGSGPTLETLASLPTSAGGRWSVHMEYDDSGLLVRVRANEDDGDPDAWVDARPSTSALPSAPEWAGMSAVAVSGAVEPSAEVYEFRLQEPDVIARNWYALADVSKDRSTVELLLDRKDRVTADAHWSRDDYAIADSPTTWCDATPLKEL